ncbi:large subunit ribosomal protein L10 [Arthrobacter pigmenti]|uniref:Large ribosomal subunit protein uL10 n=1 Tax=Arthrobacter pigmenti TaxID=271432 RepID=A0A846RSM8_9MICC|nr:50S ribosomal protein L10 [Arthrobacter pigmenti]NJC23177.1 large subunit ribosomal protein L10 [Arthrobacter pigmenti]
MATPTKVSAVDEITTDFKESAAAVLTEYRGLSVAQLKELRRSLGADTKYAVVKNTLTGIAAKEAGIDAFDGQLAGPTAIAFIKGDAVAAAKSLTDFAKTNPQLVIKTGYFEGKALDASAVTALAALESREFQLARVAGVLKAPMSMLARTVDALRIKLEENGDAAPAAAAVAPAAEEAPAAADAAPAEAAEDAAAPEEK